MKYGFKCTHFPTGPVQNLRVPFDKGLADAWYKKSAEHAAKKAAGAVAASSAAASGGTGSTAIQVPGIHGAAATANAPGVPVAVPSGPAGSGAAPAPAPPAVASGTRTTGAAPSPKALEIRVSTAQLEAWRKQQTEQHFQSQQTAAAQAQPLPQAPLQAAHQASQQEQQGVEQQGPLSGSGQPAASAPQPLAYLKEREAATMRAFRNTGRRDRARHRRRGVLR